MYCDYKRSRLRATYDDNAEIYEQQSEENFIVLIHDKTNVLRMKRYRGISSSDYINEPTLKSPNSLYREVQRGTTTLSHRSEVMSTFSEYGKGKNYSNSSTRVDFDPNEQESSRNDISRKNFFPESSRKEDRIHHSDPIVVDENEEVDLVVDEEEDSMDEEEYLRERLRKLEENRINRQQKDTIYAENRIEIVNEDSQRTSSSSSSSSDDNDEYEEGGTTRFFGIVVPSRTNTPVKKKKGKKRRRRRRRRKRRRHSDFTTSSDDYESRNNKNNNNNNNNNKKNKKKNKKKSKKKKKRKKKTEKEVLAEQKESERLTKQGTKWKELLFDKPEYVYLEFIDCEVGDISFQDYHLFSINYQYEKADAFFILSNDRLFYVKPKRIVQPDDDNDVGTGAADGGVNNNNLGPVPSPGPSSSRGQQIDVYQVYRVHLENGEDVTNVLTMCCYRLVGNTNIIMRMKDQKVIFGDLDRIVDLEQTQKKGNKKKKEEEQEQQQQQQQSEEEFYGKSSSDPKTRYVFLPRNEVSWSSGFDFFKVVIFKEQPMLFTLESARGNCELYSIDGNSFRLIWNAVIKYGQVRDFTLKNLYSNIVGLFLVKCDSEELEFENVKYVLEIRTINLTKGRIGKMVRIVEDIPFFDERFFDEFKEMKATGMNKKNMFPYPSRFRSLRFGTAVAFNSNEIRIVFFDNRLKELYQGDQGRPMYFMMNLKNLKQRSKIYSVLHDNKDISLQYRKIRSILTSRRPDNMDNNNIQNIKKEKKKLLLYFRSKRKMLNDTAFKNHIVRSFCEDLSVSVYQKKDREFFHISESIIDAYYDIFRGPCGLFFFSHISHHWSELEKEFVWPYFYVNFFFCGLVGYFYNLYLNCFCCTCSKKSHKYHEDFPFFSQQQRFVMEEMENQKKFTISPDRVQEYDKLIDKITKVPVSTFLKLTCFLIPICQCISSVFCSCCYFPLWWRNFKDFFKEHIFKVAFSMAVSTTGSMLLYFVVNFVLKKTFFTCNGEEWGKSPECSKKGYCANYGIFSQGTCVCYLGYFGDDCGLTTCYNVTSDNENFVCNGHGKCVAFNNCRCGLDWEGDNCEVYEPTKRRREVLKNDVLLLLDELKGENKISNQKSSDLKGYKQRDNHEEVLRRYV